MSLKRLIPVVLVKNGLLVRSQLFKYHQAIGDPIPTIKRLSDWNADEIVLLNIGHTQKLDSRREDKYHNLGIGNFADLVYETTKFCNCPITIGGGIRELSDIQQLFKAGADKITVNTLCFEKPELIKEAISTYGSQAITAAIDVKSVDGINYSFYENGQVNSKLNLKDSIEYVANLGVGEILLSSIDRDGSAQGYDEMVLGELSDDLTLPIILNSGSITASHFLKGLQHKSISGVAASNVFYFTELSYPIIKQEIIAKGYDQIRCPNIDQSFIGREPVIDLNKRSQLLEKAVQNKFFDRTRYNGSKIKELKFCRRCLYSSASASPMEFDESGLCMGCRVYETKSNIGADGYKELETILRKKVDETLLEAKKDRSYDCIVSVSGGKDSYYQVHYVREVLGLKPLLVTYNGNNYSQIGWENLWNMRRVFDCDHLVISPSVKIIKKLNVLAFVAMGDMNWHAHVGIYTTAPRIAVQNNIPIIFWGEHGYADLCGQFSMNDFPEMNYRERTEHAGRGFDWNFFEGLNGITSQDMEPWKYPSDKQILDCKLKQIYLGHYIPWESNKHLDLVRQEYGFKVSDEPFERTYRRGSNLDDMHENGVHDYLKYIKFGYGRCTDHASKDIRSNDLSREEGIRRAAVMDKIKSKDLKRWLEYVGMEEAEFDRIADHFRDPRVWKWSNDKGWEKQSLIQ